MIWTPDSYATYLSAGGVMPDQVDECMEWAFGPRWQWRDIGSCKDYWNKHHSVCQITNDMRIDVSLIKIGQLFIAYKLNK